MVSGFTFNSVHSKNKYIKSIKSNRILVAERKHSYVSIPHSDNVILLSDNSKQPFTLPIECLIEIPNGKSIFEVGRELDTWLTTENWSQLIFDDDSNYYYEAISISSITVDELRRKWSNEITLEFLCKPTMKVVGT
ncbi:predicted phage tail component-like protein [Ureibacillus xyleni]|uniref:Predicted phage tail component-like protein n=1 Tax=Ureibacillus xyleni TaxID=614648 RepID=A0A285SXL1_9BACL|nr:distal tail protein Dit [Ureibacillus xyleni]SOC12791.1 predicted phage tail component-like protein [Ureibacillus xyleni]